MKNQVRGRAYLIVICGPVTHAIQEVTIWSLLDGNNS